VQRQEQRHAPRLRSVAPVRAYRAYSALRAMVLYELVVLTKTKAATAQLGPLLKSCCNTSTISAAQKPSRA
jgi:hypothetical protein